MTFIPQAVSTRKVPLELGSWIIFKKLNQGRVTGHWRARGEGPGEQITTPSGVRGEGASTRGSVTGSLTISLSCKGQLREANVSMTGV